MSYKNSLIAALGFSGALMHLINHSVFKTLLFFGAGTVYQKFHSKNMELLGGLVKFAPYTAALFLIGCLGISGIPAFSGFAGEFVIYLSMIKSVSLHSKFGLIISVLSIAGLALIGAICLFCFIKLYSIVFLGNIRNKKIEESLRKNQNMDPDLSMIIPMFVLSALIILSGLFPNYLIHFISNCVNLLIRSNNSESSLNFNYIIYMASLISYSSLIFITVFIIIILIRRLLLKNRKVVYFKTWDCGYQSGNNRMQYTGSSFIRPFWNIIKMFVKIDYYRITPEGTYPKSLDFKIEVKDFIEEYIIIPLSETVKKILNLFAWMQSGNAQSYILYGIVFIIIILISIMI
ncbi:MAG TPA: proton-conducting transporter membrane subunit [bacterium]|nr:proton-conducting transporter membrane subunit [bacterium]